MTDINEIKQSLTPLFEAFGISNAVVFGSVAKGCADEKSDLDIVVDSGLKGLKFIGLTEAIQNTVKIPVDVFDVTHIDADSKLAKEISETGVKIYERC